MKDNRTVTNKTDNFFVETVLYSGMVVLFREVVSFIESCLYRKVVLGSRVKQHIEGGVVSPLGMWVHANHSESLSCYQEFKVNI